MKPQHSKKATQAILGIGAVVTLALLARAGGGISSLAGGTTIWALLPYAVLLLAAALTPTRGWALAVLVVSSLAAGFAVLVYAPPLHGSTSGLVFIFVPLYQLIVAVIVLAVVLFSRRSHDNHNA